MNEWHIWAQIDRLRAEADRLERELSDSSETPIDRFIDKHIGGFCTGFLLGMLVMVLRFGA